MSINQPKHSSILWTVIIGIVALIVLVLYLSSNDVLPPLSDFDNKNSTTTESSLGASQSLRDTKSVNRIVAPLGNIRVQVADTDATREQGLSGKKSMGQDEGMLFVFPSSGMYGFWMKDMNFPLDMVWIDANLKVVGVDANLATSTYPDTFFPPANVSYVLEVNAGVARKIGIATGTLLKF